MKVIVKHNEDPNWDWWTIERAEHDGKMWMEKTDYGARLMASSRVSDADVEGTAEEMIALAEAIHRGESESFRRCAAIAVDGGYELSSPRNSEIPGTISTAEAIALADDILAKCGAK